MLISLIEFSRVHRGRALLVLCLGMSAAFLSACADKAHRSIPARAAVRPVALPLEELFTLLIPPGEMPCPVTLYTFEASPRQRPSSFSLHYYGDKGTGYIAEIRVWVHPTSAQARASLDREAHSCAVTPLEVSGEAPYSAFSDRAFGGRERDGKRPAGRICFSRANARVAVSMHVKDGSGHNDMLVIARLVGKKIDLAASGKPPPVPFMPGITAELAGYDRDQLRSYQAFARRAWGDGGMNIAISDRNGVPRLFPAKRISDNDYLVPLTLVARLLRVYEAPTCDESRGRPAAKLNGKLFVFVDGSKFLTVDGVAHEAASRISIVDGRVVAPLSLIEYAVEKRFAWTRQAGMPMAHLPG